MVEYPAMWLGNGSRVAVVGGGPAGSFFSLHFLRYVSSAHIDAQVDIYEYRDFTAAGPKGCNRCAGVLSASLLRNMKELDIKVPDIVARAHIDSYILHSPFGTIRLPNPDPESEILSVFRGGGPLHPSQDVHGLDGFLLELAARGGASVFRQRVAKIELTPRPSLVLEDGVKDYDLVVLAGGLNSGSLQVSGLSYRRPPTIAMSQDELFCREQDIKEFFGHSVRAFLLPKTDMVFASIVPKRDFLNISLLSTAGPPDVGTFLQNDMVKAAIPFPYERSCGCRPRINVGRAANCFADGFVAIGDSCISRLYKDGIGSALLSARQAAFTAVHHGVSAYDFRSHYKPFCDALYRDNRFGGRIFSLLRTTRDSGRLFRTVAKLIGSQTSLSDSEVFRKTLWGIFTGSYSYREISDMAFGRKAIMVLAREYLKGA
ncbi:MAG: hypothetical protein HYX90_01345 [Chloroflexi bacterium]|nr:hypothetical protein [Chloroflexota bacterium]